MHPFGPDLQSACTCRKKLLQGAPSAVAEDSRLVRPVVPKDLFQERTHQLKSDISVQLAMAAGKGVLLTEEAIA
jgi:hypothetical protein